MRRAIMDLKIFLTGDNHIGLKFNRFPNDIKQDLIDARVENLSRLITTANGEKCQLFVIAGDLFDNTRVAQKEVEKVVKVLSQFEGTVLVMPGNHDYYDDMSELWKHFKKHCTDNTILLNEWKPYSLQDYHIDATIYPAYCNQKHSDQNSLGWIKDISVKPQTKWKIGIAHGSLVGLSPDLDNRYYSMSEKELEGLGMDIWLLGHTHIPYPFEKEVYNRRVFNGGTPEPDGLDCKHGGHAWLISINEEKQIQGKQIETGSHRFYDLDRELNSMDCLDKLKKELLSGSNSKKVIRLNLSGRIEREILNELQPLYQEIRDNILHLIVDESSLKPKISNNDIQKEFTKDSFPYEILNMLMEEDEEALQLAYDLIRGCKNEN